MAGVARVRQLRPRPTRLLSAVSGRVLEHQQGAGLHFLARTHRQLNTGNTDRVILK